MIAMITLLAVLFGVVAECACVPFTFCPEVKDEHILINVRCWPEGPDARPKNFRGKWNITGIKTKEGCPLSEALRSVGYTLYSNPGPSEFLEMLMDELRSTGGYGDKFSFSGSAEPLWQGIPYIDRGLVWKVIVIRTLSGAPMMQTPRDLAGEDVDTEDLSSDVAEPWHVITLGCSGLIIKGYREVLCTKRVKLG